MTLATLNLRYLNRWQETCNKIHTFVMKVVNFKQVAGKSCRFCCENYYYSIIFFKPGLSIRQYPTFEPKKKKIKIMTIFFWKTLINWSKNKKKNYILFSLSLTRSLLVLVSLSNAKPQPVHDLSLCDFIFRAINYIRKKRESEASSTMSMSDSDSTSSYGSDYKNFRQSSREREFNLSLSLTLFLSFSINQFLFRVIYTIR